MAKNKGRIENLKVPTPEEARRNGSEGGKKSVQVRRERKLLSQIYSEVLAELYDTEEGSPLLDTIKQIIARNDAASVSILKEIREATEGNKVDIGGEGIRIVYQVADGQTDSSK